MVTQAAPAPGSSAEATDLLTVGVEEEFLLVDPDTGVAVPAVEAVLDQVPAELRGQVEREFQTSQIEIGSPPGLELSSIRHSLGLLRASLADAAERAGARLLAIGTGPIDGPVPAVVDKPRFDRMLARFRLLVPGPGNNGMHVHVGVPDPDAGVQVLNHVRPWLPILHAVTANSPFSRGADTGYASWRSIEWERWPSVAPTPYLVNHEHYQRLIRQLISSGVMLDEGMLYWYARLSAKYPTVELRIGDVCPTVDDAVLVAALVRGLVATALDDIAAGRPPLPTDHHLLVGAHWRAAHDGLEGEAVDLSSGELRPAWDLLHQLVGRLGPALERHGDLAEVTSLLEGLRRHGSGAQRQRSVYARTGRLEDVVTDVARQTRGGDPA
ncbi:MULTISPECIES: glutamate--cysteine ligase [unclassified Micromonospora]|uniref:carboxylate-amine ligase n=1 Tax=unclassified Micromonospora TaxID=2617518 RepID=UPI0022B6A7FD|nr:MULTISPECIES: glutamate--cysteine ligase [unclassified Micromonospora]MCZ7418843.1 glutamate--cysteine ligase [Verrucosispora sp. WMMA2121]WBB92538.1 glutamate--cysteine ligase [Verrucosispora sp. WMMC514]